VTLVILALLVQPVLVVHKERRGLRGHKEIQERQGRRERKGQ
jgi:hypothetical protein